MIRVTAAVVFVLLAAASFGQTVCLKVQEFDPVSSGMRARPEVTLSEQGARHILVQLRSVPTTADRRFLSAAGAAQLEYVPHNAYVFKADDALAARLAAWPRMRYVGEFLPAYKIDPEIGKRRFDSLVRTLLSRIGIYDLVVTLHDGEMPTAVRTSGQVLSVDRCGPRYLISLRANENEIVALARQDAVAFIEEASEPTLRNDTTCWVIQTNQQGNTAIWNRGLMGQNLIAGLIDTKMYMGHNDFRDDTNNTAGPNHRKVVMYNSNSGQSGGDYHGTHTAGTLVGDHQPIDGSTYRNGMAYKARVAFTNLSDVSSGNLYSKFVTAYQAGARDNSNSWGDDSTRQYTSWCQQIDQFSWDYEDAMVAFAVSNGSVCTTPENAKSCLAVGASQQAPNQDFIGSGGTGPTADGRRKPEIFAPGINIWSAKTGTTDQWYAMSGTSMACPAVTGGAVLCRQWLRDGYALDGTPRGPSYIAPITGALVRAMVLNGTVDMTGINGYPSNREGWGRMLLDNVLWFADENRRTIPWVVRNANGMTLGQERVFSINVLDSSQPLKITMTFTDYPGAAFASDPVVNNLDLEVVAPDGTTYLGNVFANGQSAPGGQADLRNSTEMVLLNAPQTGVWRIRVKETALNNGAAQGFAVVANGIIQRSPGG